jgi:hypothetical protein
MQLVKQQMLWSVGRGPRRWWGRTSTIVEVHAEEERVRDMNLNGKHAGGVDLDDGCTVEAHVEEEWGVQHEPRRQARWWHGPRWLHAVEAHVEEERDIGVEMVDAVLRQTWRRSGHQWVCGEKMTGLGFRDLITLKKENSSDRRGWLRQHAHR